MLSFFKRYTTMPYQAHSMTYAALWFYSLIAALLFIPSDALAANSLGDMICNVGQSGTSYPDFLAAIAYCMGTILILRGTLLLKKVSDAPGQTSPVIGIAHMMGGVFLMALPAFTGFLQNTFFDVVAGEAIGCTPGEVGGDDLALDLMMTNFVGNIHEPIFGLLALLGYVVGATYIVMGLLRMVKIGTDPRAANPKDILVYLVVGSVLMSLSMALPMIMGTIFGGTDISDMSNFEGISWTGLVGNANTDAADNTIRAVLAFVQIIGGISFLRGWLLVKRAVEGGGQATIPQGVTHILGGAMAINIDVMLEVFDGTFGTNLVN